MKVLNLILISLVFSLAASSCLEREELAVRDSDCITFITELKAPKTPNVKSFSENLQW